MTVERLIELLQREYPQALVQIEVEGPSGHATWDSFRGCFVLNPFRVQPRDRQGLVTILCDQHDC